MSGTLRSASLRYVGLQQDTSIYELQSAQFANKYFIISGEGSRRLMASPEVVGFDSYRSLLGETVDALRFLFPSGGDVDIMTILRGGLNYPIEEACFRSGVRVRDMHFVSCECIIYDGGARRYEIPVHFREVFDYMSPYVALLRHRKSLFFIRNLANTTYICV